MTEPSGPAPARGAFRVGDRVQLTDAKGRQHTITLEAGKAFHTHTGSFQHDELIGAPEGSVVRSTGGTAYLVVARNLGADSLRDWLVGQGWPTDRLASQKGYRVLVVHR